MFFKEISSKVLYSFCYFSLFFHKTAYSSESMMFCICPLGRVLYMRIKFWIIVTFLSLLSSKLRLPGFPFTQFFLGLLGLIYDIFPNHPMASIEGFFLVNIRYWFFASFTIFAFSGKKMYQQEIYQTKDALE